MTGIIITVYYYSYKQTREIQMTTSTETILNQAATTLKNLFPGKKFNLIFRDWDGLVTVRKGNTKGKVFGYIEVSQGKTIWSPVN